MGSYFSRFLFFLLFNERKRFSDIVSYRAFYLFISRSSLVIGSYFSSGKKRGSQQQSAAHIYGFLLLPNNRDRINQRTEPPRLAGALLLLIIHINYEKTREVASSRHYFFFFFIYFSQLQITGFVDKKKREKFDLHSSISAP